MTKEELKSWRLVIPRHVLKAIEEEAVKKYVAKQKREATRLANLQEKANMRWLKAFGFPDP